MDNRKKWETAAAYLAGIVLLAISVVLAWFVPGEYSEWQDQRLLNVSILSSRDDIEFLDMEALEMEERMRLLKETDRMVWLEPDEFELSEAELAERRVVCKEELQRWAEGGLLPEECLTLLFEEGYVEGANVRVSLTDKILNCNVLFFQDDFQENQMMVLLDEERDIVYYVAMLGYQIQEYMAKRLGYESLEHILWQVLEGQPLEQQEDYTGYDFAQVCRAEAAEIQGSPGELNFDVALDYETFTGYACRRVLCYDGTYGISIALGTEKWVDFLEQATGYDENFRWALTTEEWQNQMVMNYYGIEKVPEDFGTDASSYGEVYEEAWSGVEVE